MFTVSATPNVYRAVEAAVTTDEAEERAALLDALFGVVDGVPYEQLRKARAERQSAAVQLVAWEDALAAAATAAGLDYRPDYHGEQLRVEFSWSFGVSADLGVCLDWGSRETLPQTLPNGARTWLRSSVAKVEINWGSTGSMSAGEAVAKLALYGQVVAVAQMFTAALGSRRYLTRDAWTELAALAARSPEDVADEMAEEEAKGEAIRAENAARKAADAARAAKKAARAAARA